MLSAFEISSLPPIMVLGKAIKLSKTAKNLGVMFNQHLSWSDHVNLTSKRAFAALHALVRLKHFLPVSIKIKLVQALVFPHFDYCDSVHSELPDDLAQRLQRVQNTCVRFIFDLKYRDHLSVFFTKLNWLKLIDRRKVHNLTLLYRAISSKEPLISLADSQCFPNLTALTPDCEGELN